MNVLGIPRTPSACEPSLTIGSILSHGVADAPRQQIVHGTRRHTYLQLEERVHRLASMLAALGVVPGSTVAVMDWDSARYLECFFAVPMMGAVLHTVNVRMPPEQVLYTINHAKDDVIVVNADFLPLLRAIHAQVRPGVKFVVACDAPSIPPHDIPLEGEYEALLAAASPCYAFPELPEDTRATTFYTTGTTGLPKGVYFSHRQLVLHTYAIAAQFGAAFHARFTADDVYMPITPMFHVHAWGFPYLATLIGAKQVYPGRYVPETLLALIDREKVTFSHCVPTILQMILASPALEGVDLHAWKVVIGGSALPLGLARAARAKGADIVAGYGMSETGPVLTIAHLRGGMDAWHETRSMPYRCRAGRPIPGVELRIVDPGMRPLPHDGVAQGEIVVRAPWLTQGYLGELERSEDLWQGGWLHTGDVGVIDEHGYLKIVDRLKDVIKTGGEWVSSLDLEDIILRLPGVAEVAVVGLPDEKWGERPVALVVARPGAQAPDEDAVRRHVSDVADLGMISRYAVPDRVEFVDAIPKTSVGKLDKKAIRASLLREPVPA
ncbi:MAG TPA: fatty acid--CoA ligase [Usitatibacter sp.]|jgi:fatty-acyl-CoA synthase|nr:fatty acid--CoA ligase [Usitatibacter sp.]